MTPGFVYILSNPSMPGQVKIGKTTRDPGTRVAELSSATGVPTEFNLEYYEAFDDCHTAERLIHQQLTEAGYRVSGRREFFRMSVEAAIEAVDLLPGKALLDDERLSAEELFELGELYDYGSTEVLKDAPRAVYYYKQAARLGHAEAGYAAADALLENHPREAFQFAASAANAGLIPAEAQVARILREQEQPFDAEIRYRQFFSEVESLELIDLKIQQEIHLFLIPYIAQNGPIPSHALPALARHRKAILNRLYEHYRRYPDTRNAWMYAWKNIPAISAAGEHIKPRKAASWLPTTIIAGGAALSAFGLFIASIFVSGFFASVGCGVLSLVALLVSLKHADRADVLSGGLPPVVSEPYHIED